MVADTDQIEPRQGRVTCGDASEGFQLAVVLVLEKSSGSRKEQSSSNPDDQQDENQIEKDLADEN